MAARVTLWVRGSSLGGHHPWPQRVLQGDPLARGGVTKGVTTPKGTLGGAANRNRQRRPASPRGGSGEAGKAAAMGAPGDAAELQADGARCQDGTIRAQGPIRQGPSFAAQVRALEPRRVWSVIAAPGHVEAPPEQGMGGPDSRVQEGMRFHEPGRAERAGLVDGLRPSGSPRPDRAAKEGLGAYHLVPGLDPSSSRMRLAGSHGGGPGGPGDPPPHLLRTGTRRICLLCDLLV